MPIPIVPILKLIALSSIKIVALGIGALVIPVWTVRLVIGGTGESVRFATNWMVEEGKLPSSEANEFLQSLDKIQSVSMTRKQARHLLFSMIKKSLTGMAKSIGSLWGRVVRALKSKS